VILSGAQFRWCDLLANDGDGFIRLVQNFGKFFAAHSAPDDPYRDLFAILQLTHVSKEQLGLVVQLDATGQDKKAKLDKFMTRSWVGSRRRSGSTGCRWGSTPPSSR
jgi:hypothetical protein